MPKQKPLVCQHLEKISRVALEKYQDIIREYIRGRHGIYALYRRDKLYYVGLASNLRVRLRQHLHDKHESSWDRFSVYLVITNEHMKELESLLLRIGSPSGNKQVGSFYKSENLKRRLATELRARQRDELDALLGRKKGKGRKQKEKGPKKKRKGGEAVLAPYMNKRMVIRRRYKGKLVKATVRKNGTINYKGKVYNSPSAAGIAVIGRSCNGWTFWLYERAPGEWIPLNQLRH